MGSSSGGDYSTPPRSPAPPGNLISPPGQTAPFTPNFINFLGDTNVPSTGLTPEMLAAIDAMSRPASGSTAPPTVAPPTAAAPTQQTDPRAQLMQLMMGGGRRSGSFGAGGGHSPGYGGRGV